MNSLDVPSLGSKTLMGLIPVTIGSLFLYCMNTSKKKKLEEALEYPPVAPVGTLQWIKARSCPDYPLQFLQWCRDMDSPVYRLKTLLYDMVLTDDIHLFRQILKDKETYKPTEEYDVLKVIHDGGEDIVCSEGVFWKHSRKAIAPAFSSSHLKRMTETVKRKTDDFIKSRLDPMSEKGESIDICKELVDLTLSIISEAAFEYEMSHDEKEVIINGFALTLKEGIKCMVFPLRSRFGKYIFPEAKKAHLFSLKLIELGENILNFYRDMDNPTKGTVIDQIAQNTNYNSDKERVSDILVMIFAGHDTTGYSLSWILLELAKKPHELRLLRNELRSHPEEERSSLKILRNVVKEGLRLQPVTPMQLRVVNKDIIYRRDEHSKGILIAKGRQVICSNFLLCRNEKYFKDADDFVPSRWDDASDDAIAVVTPFSIGRRNCVGQSLAMVELHCVLARLCSDYDFSVADEGVPTFHVSWKPAGARLNAKRYGKG